jgi:DNA replication and repair protein RecF
MRLARLEVADFRNHPQAAIDLDPGPNLLVGPNGVGKTNLLEAITFLATLGSHRSSQDWALVRSGAEAALIRAAVLHANRRVLVELEIRPGTGVRGRLNRSQVPRARDLLGGVRAVLFAPEDLALVRGDPDERRRFLDLLAVQRLPRFHGTRQDYERILKQRNSLLRSAVGRPAGGAVAATLDVWDERLALAGAEVWAERLRLVDTLRPLVTEAYQELAGHREAVELTYAASAATAPAGDTEAPPPAAELATVLRERLARDRRRELERGVTLSGPHRDDLVFALGGLPARSHASHGEAWSLALSLRLAAHRWLAAEGDPPILLLDDVFAELDRDRRRRLAAAAAAAEQAIITAAVPEEVPRELGAARFAVAPGEVRRVDDGSVPGREGPRAHPGPTAATAPGRRPGAPEPRFGPPEGTTPPAGTDDSGVGGYA